MMLNKSASFIRCVLILIAICSSQTSTFAADKTLEKKANMLSVLNALEQVIFALGDEHILNSAVYAAEDKFKSSLLEKRMEARAHRVSAYNTFIEKLENISLLNGASPYGALIVTTENTNKCAQNAYSSIKKSYDPFLVLRLVAEDEEHDQTRTYITLDSVRYVKDNVFIDDEKNRKITKGTLQLGTTTLNKLAITHNLLSHCIKADDYAQEQVKYLQHNSVKAHVTAILIAATKAQLTLNAREVYVGNEAWAEFFDENGRVQYIINHLREKYSTIKAMIDSNKQLMDLMSPYTTPEKFTELRPILEERDFYLSIGLFDPLFYYQQWDTSESGSLYKALEEEYILKDEADYEKLLRKNKRTPPTHLTDYLVNINPELNTYLYPEEME